jgi:hypothetical protein
VQVDGSEPDGYSTQEAAFAFARKFIAGAHI